MLKAELYRIFSRKTVLAGMLIPILFVIFLYGGISVWEEGVVDEGRVYQGGEAITRDQEIAEEFAGTLTEETVREIWNRYGPSMIYQNRDTSRENLETLAKIGKNDNFCNRFVTRLFCRRKEGNREKLHMFCRRICRKIRCCRENIFLVTRVRDGTGIGTSFLWHLYLSVL